MIATVNPATGETVATFEALTEPQLEEKLARSAEAYRAYRRTTFADRARWMARAAAILETERDAFGRIMTLEMGKPIEAARQEAAKCALACRYYVEHGERLLADEPVDLGGPRAFHPLSTHRPRAGRDALEFSLLAGLPISGACADGRERGAAEAFLQRPAVRAGHRRHRATRRFSRRCFSDAADRVATWCGA